jgi:IstB-like ATP binding protein
LSPTAPIAERYERNSTIVTSNLHFDEWPDAVPANRILAEATIDRLRHGAYRIVLDGDSYRAPRDAKSAPTPPLLPKPRNPPHPDPVREPFLGLFYWLHWAGLGWLH